MLILILSVPITIWGIFRGNFLRCLGVWVMYIVTGFFMIRFFAQYFNPADVFGAALSPFTSADGYNELLGFRTNSSGLIEQGKANSFAISDVFISLSFIVSLYLAAAKKKPEPTTVAPSSSPYYSQTEVRSQNTQGKYLTVPQSAANSLTVRVVNNLVIFEQMKEYYTYPCTIFLGLTNGAKRLIGQTNPIAQVTLEFGEYVFSAEINGLVLQTGTLSIIDKESPKAGAIALEYKEEDLSKALAQLKQAGQMLKDGIISKEEFDKMKSKIIQ